MSAWVFLDSVLADIDVHVATPPAEQGGALLGHVDVPDTIVRFLPDPTAATTATTYTCSRELAAAVRTLESSSGYRLVGIVHSHPGSFDQPSSQDEIAFRETLTTNPWMGRMVAPIITRGSPSAAHELALPHGKLSMYDIRCTKRAVDVRPSVARVLPLAADVSRLQQVEGVELSTPRPVSLDGVGYFIVDVAGRGQVQSVLFPAGYPWQGPLVVAIEGAEATPHALPWDLSVAASDRLAHGWHAFYGSTMTRATPPSASVHLASDASSRLSGLLTPLHERSVLIVGAGSVGSFIAEVLVRHGVGKITVVDGDVVEAPNLSRTVYRWADLGRSKVDALSDFLTSIRPDVSVTGIREPFEQRTDADVGALVKQHDLVVGATDDMRIHSSLNAFAWSAGVPAVYPAIYREAAAGEIVLAVPRPAGVCWRCTILGAAANSDGEQPHDYGTGRTAAVTALGADIWTISASAAKACLGLLHLVSGGQGPLMRYVAVPITRGTTLVQIATTPGWSQFEDWFSDAPAQWALQSVWMTPQADEQCPVCGPNPTPPRLPRDAPIAELRQALQDSVGRAVFAQMGGLATPRLATSATGAEHDRGANGNDGPHERRWPPATPERLREGGGGDGR